MAITAQEILDRAAELLHDESFMRWPDTELLAWLNEGRRTIATLRPDAYATQTVLAMASGTRQSLPADAYAFLGAVRNMVGGVNPSTTVRAVDKALLDTQAPDWHTATATALVSTCSPDPMVPTQFYVYPPNTGAGHLEVTYARVPADVALADGIGLNDKFAPCLVDYVVHRAESKDAETASVAALAAAYFEKFKAMVAEVK